MSTITKLIEKQINEAHLLGVEPTKIRIHKDLCDILKKECLSFQLNKENTFQINHFMGIEIEEIDYIPQVNESTGTFILFEVIFQNTNRKVRRQKIY